MTHERDTTPSAASLLKVGDTYQLTLAGLVFPVPAHLAFNLVATVAILLLGHPWLAAGSFVATAVMDVVWQHKVRGWLAASHHEDRRGDVRRLAAFCVLRNLVCVSAPFALALTGGLGEQFFFGVQVCALLAMAGAAGSLERPIFWALAAPVLIAAAALAALRLPPVDAVAAALSLASLVMLMVIISQAFTRTMKTWHAAFTGNVQLVHELAAARDQALAERAAADEAREEARRATRATSAFLATMSHEIRTPMNGVLGMAQLLKRDEKDPVQSARLATLIDSGEYLLAILNDVLDVSKMDAGHLKIVRGVEDLRLFLDRLVGFWHGRAEEKGIELRLSVAEDVPDHVWMDAVRLRQVMFNLVGNALKFTAKGHVEVLAEVGSVEDGKVLLHLAVRDTGPGIAAHYLPILFDRFSQADETEARAAGTGLGLSIAKQLTELMDGRIWVESEPGVGSTFHVELPLELAQAFGVRHAPAAEAEPAAPASNGALKLLAVDDNAVNLTVLDQLLSSLGHQVAKAASGSEALDLLEAQPFDLVLLDIQMPGLSGDEVLRRHRARPGPNRATPVIALTADVEGGRERFLNMGFADLTTKPIQVGELLGAIDRAVTAAPAAQDAARSA
jgi:signal transduction histidine kinase/CheY-like chemotaxis protein